MNMKKLICVILLTAVISAVTVPALDVGDNAAPFVLLDMNRSYVYSKDFYTGEYWVLLDFFATWCVPCKEKLPHIEELFMKYRERGLKTYLVATDTEGADVLKPFFQSRPTPVPVLVDRYSVVAKKYGVLNLPTLILVSPDGKIVYRLEGKSDTMIEDLEGFLADLSG